MASNYNLRMAKHWIYNVEILRYHFGSVPKPNQTMRWVSLKILRAFESPSSGVTRHALRTFFSLNSLNSFKLFFLLLSLK